MDETAYNFEKEQSVIMVIGVNGVGKTTSVGKLAGKLKDEGETLSVPVAGRSQLFQLFDNTSAVFLLPLPGSL